jgi:hypothetical protein
MKISELIEQLGKYPQDLEVKHWVNCYEALEKVTQVEIEDDCISLA